MIIKIFLGVKLVLEIYSIKCLYYKRKFEINNLKFILRLGKKV